MRSQNDTEMALLQQLNDEKALQYLLVIVFLVVLCLVGTLGNVLVLLVYWHKRYKASSHYFILTLAMLDLLTCVVGLPTEIADLRFPFMFDAPVACKILRFVHSTTTISSSCILIQVAFDRFYRICRLGQQFSVKKARALCVVSVLLAVASAWPSLLLFGRHSVLVARMEGGLELWGVDCTTDDGVRDTIYPTIYVIFLFSLFFITVAFFAVLYSRIGVEIWRRKRITIGAKVPITTHASKSVLTSQSSDPTSTEISSGEAEEGKGGMSSKAPPLPAKTSQSGEAGQGKSGGGNSGMRVGKTTTVLFVVTLAYVLSFLPYLIVMVMRSVIKDFEEELSPIGEVVYKFCVKSFFINNAINPIIYSFLNASFRKDTRTLLRKMICCRCCCSGQNGV